MRTLRIHHAPTSTSGIARLIANRIALRLQRHRLTFIQVAALLPLLASHHNLRREHDGVGVGFDNNRLRLSYHRLLAEVAWLRALGAFGLLRIERAYLVTQLDHHRGLRRHVRIARLHALILHRAVKERRELPNRSQFTVVDDRLLLAAHRCDLSISPGYCNWNPLGLLEEQLAGIVLNR